MLGSFFRIFLAHLYVKGCTTNVGSPKDLGTSLDSGKLAKISLSEYSESSGKKCLCNCTSNCSILLMVVSPLYQFFPATSIDIISIINISLLMFLDYIRRGILKDTIVIIIPCGYDIETFTCLVNRYS